tara:strand:+ start:4204 stop:7659 length:3456 start_codon:yes stop_codon:yes gene_type:complete
MAGFTFEELSGQNQGGFTLGELGQQPTTSMLPEPGTYTQDDMVENDNMYSIIEGFMYDRYGPDAFIGNSRAKVVDKFLNNRRGVAVGNTVRGLNEWDYINDIKGDDDKMARAASAYHLYENMAGLFSEETSFAERAEGVMDYTRSAILDPINLIGGLIGKAAAGGAVRVGTDGARRLAYNEMKKKAATGASQKQIAKEGKKQFTAAMAKANTANVQKIGEYSAKILGTTGAKRLTTKAALTEIGVTATVDSVVGVGMEALYQEGLIDLGVRDEYDKFAMGIAAIGGIVVGGTQATGVVLKRGWSETVMPTVGVPQPTSEGFLSEISKAIENYTNQTIAPIGRDWKTKVKGGMEFSKESKDLSTDFFTTLMLGHQTETGEVIFKGMTQTAMERGFVWGKRFEDDKFTNWMADIISGVSDKEAQEFLTAIEKATGNKIKNKKKLTGRDVGDILAYKMSESGRALNAVSQSARQLGLSVSDLELKHLFDEGVEMGLIPKPKGQVVAENITTDVIRNTQNKMIRLLVSNPATSALNVIGYGTNMALNTTSDIALSAAHMSYGTLKKLVGASKSGAKSQRMAEILFKNTVQRFKFMFDPDMTYAAFQSALTRNSETLQRLNNVLPGGVENATNILTKGKFNATTKLIDIKTDELIDIVQTMTLVNAQDSFTKSLEFTTQMDKLLRTAYGRGWNEFYSWDGAAKAMTSKEYRLLEAEAVDKTLEAIFSKSYAGPGPLGQIAEVIEDARNLPFIGLQIPFGRFFNNTVAFAGRNTPFVNMAFSVAKMSDEPLDKAFAKTVVAGTLLWHMSNQEMENIEDGLPLYATRDPITGEIINQRYDYPISYFKALARMSAYKMRGERVPKSESDMMMEDFGLGSITRNLTKSQRDLLEPFKNMAEQPEIGDILNAAGEVLKSSITTQPASAILRPLEPANIAVGVLMKDEARPIDRYQNNKALNDSLRYIDKIVPLFTGEPMAETLEQAASGPADVNSTKMFGIRTLRLTDTQRLMSMIGVKEFSINAARKVRTQAPQAANRYNGILFDIIEAEAGLLVNNKKFKKLPQGQQKIIWNNTISRSKDLAKTFLYLQYSGPLDTIDIQFQLTNKYSKQELADAANELESIEGEVENMTRGELEVLRGYLETKEALETFKIPLGAYGN